MLNDLYVRLRSLFRRATADEELDRELQFHLDNQTEKYVQLGLRREEAARRARLEFGGLDQIRQSCREARGITLVETLAQDLRYAVRCFARSPGFTLTVVTSLALAIGANTAIFSLAKEVLYERLGGVPHPDELRLLRWNAARNQSVAQDMWGGDNFGLPDGTTTSSVFSYPVFRELRAHNQALQDLFAFKEDWMNATIRGNAQRMQVEMVTGNYYQELGIRPQLGRAIQEADDAKPGSGAVALISDRVWAREFGRSPAVLGQTIKVNGCQLTIIGVNPLGFGGAWSVQQPADVMVPLAMQPLLHPMTMVGARQDSLDLLGDGEGTMWWLNLMARAKPGVKDAEAAAALSVEMNAAVRATLAVKAGQSIPRIVLDAGGRGLHFFSDYRYGKPVVVLVTLTGLVLMLACANIANLLLARSAQRQREIGVRLAPGASRGRILRQLLTESLLLAAAGGLSGFAIGYLARNAIPALIAHSWDPNRVGVPIDWRVFGFTAAVTILTGILFGLAPAWMAARAEVGSNLKEGARTSAGRRKGLSGRMLVGVQIALSTLLLVSAGLFLRTVFALYAIDTGFRADHLVLFDVNLPEKRYADRTVQFHERLEQALLASPGVIAATSMSSPLMAGLVSNAPILVEGESREQSNWQSIDYDDVGNSFFQTMGIPIVAGRGFGSQDTSTSPLVAVINRSLARARFGGSNPIGRRFTYGEVENVQVIGICGDTHYANLRDDPPPQFFIPYVQRPWEGGMDYAIRTRLSAGAIVPSLRRAMLSIDPDLPMLNVRTEEEQIAANVQMERTFAALTTGFGFLALALACVGIYGVVNYSVARRTNEIGIRLALGAQPGQVRRMILGESTLMTLAGVAAGLSVALVLVRLVKSMIFGIEPYDPVTIFACILALLGVALGASWIPARRASAIQPMDALRHE